MKIKAYKATKKKNIHLKLNETLAGVDVIVVNEDGSPVTCGTILTIGQNGIRLHTNVDKNIELPRSNNGAVIAI